MPLKMALCRGGDTFCPPREGVEGLKIGGKPNFVGENRDFSKTWKRKAIFYSKIGAISLLRKPQK